MLTFPGRHTHSSLIPAAEAHPATERHGQFVDPALRGRETGHKDLCGSWFGNGGLGSATDS